MKKQIKNNNYQPDLVSTSVGVAGVITRVPSLHSLYITLCCLVVNEMNNRSSNSSQHPWGSGCVHGSRTERLLEEIDGSVSICEGEMMGNILIGKSRPCIGRVEAIMTLHCSIPIKRMFILLWMRKGYANMLNHQTYQQIGISSWKLQCRTGKTACMSDEIK